MVVSTDPLARIDLGFLPGDANADRVVTLADHAELVDVLAGQTDPILARHDINRDGFVTNADKVRLVALFSGTDTTQAWLNYALPARP